jgi:hypothetical protein
MVTVRVDARKVLARSKVVQAELKKRFRQEIIDTALTDIETPAKMKLTTDGHILTGRLRASIHTEYTGSGSYTYRDMYGKGFKGNFKTDRPRNNMDIVVGTNVVYARHIERIDSYIYYAYKKAMPALKRRINNMIRGL